MTKKKGPALHGNDFLTRGRGFLMVESVQPALEPLGIFPGVRRIADRFGHQFFIGTDHDIERLGGVLEVFGLQGGEFITDRVNGFYTAITGWE